MSANNSRTQSAVTTKKKECFVFEPQQWRRSVCKNCFRSLHDHPTEPPSGGNGKGLSPRTSPLLGKKLVSGNATSSASATNTKDPVILRKSENSPTARRRPKSDEFKQKTPSPRQSQRSQASGGKRSPNSSPSSSTTRHSGSFTQNRQSSTSSIDVKYVEELENDFFDLEDKYDGLCKEKFELEGDIAERNRTIEELQEDVESYKIKILQLERRVQHLDEEIRSYRERLRLPESDQANVDTAGAIGSQHQEMLAENEQLRGRLEEIEQLCQEVIEENEVLKDEQEEMQREIEEMHDHFQEDDTDTLRELKRDLETSNKNCRIFQFKLRKTERRYEQCENERAALEDKLNRLESQLYSESDVNMIRSLEEELRVAKEVSVRLNSELELVDEKRSYFEEDNKHLKEDLQDSEKRRKMLEGELSKCRQEIEKLKSMDPGGLMIPEIRKTKKLESLSREPSFEEQSLQRELDAAKERETDLNEQLKFSEDEIRKLKRRLNDAEEENDSLSKKLESLMTNKNMDDTEYEDMPAHALKIQIELLDHDNSTLRKKLVLMEKENTNLINDMTQNKSQVCQEKGSTTADDKCQELENKVADLIADLNRLETENRRLSSLNVSGSNSSNPPPQYHIDADFIQGVQNQSMKQECTKMKDQIKQYDQQIQNLINQIEQNYGSQADDQKQLDMLLKYNEVTASFREQQKEIIQIRRHMDARNEEYDRYKEFYDKNTKCESRKRSDTKSSLETASKAVLLDEIVCLEEEIDELSSKCNSADMRMANLSKTIVEKDVLIEDLANYTERNETEFNQYIQNILTKNSLLTDLLTCVEARARDLQCQFDKMIGLESSLESLTSTTTDTESVDSKSAVASGSSSDNVFQQASTAVNLNDIEKIKLQFSNLERLLSEERKRTRLAEKQVEIVSKDGAFSRLNDDSRMKKKEIERLKRDLEERNEILEEKEQNLQDMRGRLEQTRKMNEALRTLLDKQDDAVARSPPQKTRDSKEANIEINSYKKEINIMKAEMHQYVIKISESEKIRENLAKDIRNLQSEMKVREEQIYEQDDEMRAKDQEIRSMKRLYEESQNKHQENDRCEELREKNSQIEMLNIEIDHVRKSLQNYKSHCDELEMVNKQNDNQHKSLSDSIRARDERIKEKDDLISHLNQRLLHREKELTDFDLIIKETNEKMNRNEQLLKDVQMKLSTKEQEAGHLKSKVEELQTSHHNLTGHLNSVNKDMESYKSQVLELEKDRSKPPMVPRIPSTTTQIDVEALKNEVAQLKKDKENLMEKINKSKGTFSALKKDSDTAKSDSEAYTKAIQQQQYLTRVTLLTDNVTRLNRANIELKLYNESIQNDMLEYQRRYKNIKEQYESQEETWAAERITLESRMKEYEDRKSVIVSVRKSLQEASLKVAQVEAQLSREKQEHELKLADQERTRSDLQKKLSQYEEKEKLPKVFQRFGGKMSSRTAIEIVQDKEKIELRIKLETADKVIKSLRSEIIEKEDCFTKTKSELLSKSEETRLHLEGLIQEMSSKLAEMEVLKEHLFILRERIFTLEESQERNRKIWNEERMVFQFKLEDSRMFNEGWLQRIKDAEREDEGLSRNAMESLEKDIEKYLYAKESIPYAQMCRRIQSQQESLIHSSGTNPPSTPFGKPPMKSVSLDWTNRTARPQPNQDVSSSNQSINSSPFSRCNRSVSPDPSKYSLTTKKITNYPDPTPGFMLKSSSRQSSIESVSNESDYTLRSFTLPGMRNSHNASRISPARQRFFETTSSAEHLPSPTLAVPANLPDSKTSAASPNTDPPKPIILATVTVPRDIQDPIPPKSDVKVTFSQPLKATTSSNNLTPSQDIPQTRPSKPKSTSIAPSIQNLRMKFAQKSSSASSCESVSTKK